MRPLLSRKVRSVLTLATLVAQGCPHENGVSKAEITEILLHAMIYCAVPKAVEGFRSLEEVLREIALE